MIPKDVIKGRGAQHNAHNRFMQHVYETRDDFLEFCRLEGEEADNNRTDTCLFFRRPLWTRWPVPMLGCSIPWIHIRDASMVAFIAMPAIRMNFGATVPALILSEKFYSKRMRLGSWKQKSSIKNGMQRPLWCPGIPIAINPLKRSSELPGLVWRYF